MSTPRVMRDCSPEPETARIFSPSPRLTSLRLDKLAVERLLTDVPPDRILLPVPEEVNEGVFLAYEASERISLYTAEFETL